MFFRILLLLSLVLNGYFYVFHFNTSKVVVETIKEKAKEEITQSKLIKKSRLVATIPTKEKTMLDHKKPEKTEEKQETQEVYFDPTVASFEDHIQEKLKYQFNISEEKIENYQDLKSHYREATNKVFQIPKNHNPDDPYVPSHKENKKYFDLIDEYHTKLKSLFGSKRYIEYEKMRKANNRQFMKEYYETDGQTDLQYMHF